jgi:hypothetical protein
MVNLVPLPGGKTSGAGSAAGADGLSQPGGAGGIRCGTSPYEGPATCWARGTPPFPSGRLSREAGSSARSAARIRAISPGLRDGRSVNKPASWPRLRASKALCIRYIKVSWDSLPSANSFLSSLTA